VASPSKGKAIPLQAWTGCREVQDPGFQDNRHMKAVRLSALGTGRLYPPPPRNIPGVHFCQRLSRPRTIVWQEGLFYLFIFVLNQQSEYRVFYKLKCWLAGSLTCRLPNVMWSSSEEISYVHSLLMFGSSWMRFLGHTQRRATVGRTPLDE